MNRRSFLGVTAALVTSWLITTRRPSHAPDLSAFCWDEPYTHPRYPGMSTPFAQTSETGLYRYATDGRVCVRVGIHPGDVIDRERVKLPPASGLPWNGEPRGVWRAWPRQHHILASDTDCPQCRGTGDLAGIGQECETCDGTGEEWMGRYGDLSRPVTCRTCRGRGCLVKDPCPNCKGNAIAVFPGLQRLEHVYVAAEYDRKVRTLPDVEYFAPERHDDKVPVRFRFAGGGVGLLMPIVTEAAEKRIREARV